MLSPEQIARAERDMNTLTVRINETFKHRHEGEAAWSAWEKSTREFRTYENPVFLLWRSEVLAAIVAGNRNEVKGALAFLEADPYFFRSRYLKEKVLHAIKRAPLDKRDEAHLQMIVLRTLEGRYKREFPFYARLIPRLRSEQFEAKLRVRCQYARCPNHARLVLNALDNHA